MSELDGVRFDLERAAPAVLQRHGIQADATAARRFRAALTRLVDALDDDERDRASRDAGDALLSLAASGLVDQVRAAMTPDPVATFATWTVCCYQVGDLTPSGMKDFPDPVAALAWLASCDEAAHVAAELVASTATGLRWTALVRTNDQVRFRLLSDSTAQDDDGGATLAAAEAAWRDQLRSWNGSSVPAVVPAPVASPIVEAVVEPVVIVEPSPPHIVVVEVPAPAPAAPIIVAAPAPIVHDVVDPTLLRRVDALEGALASIGVSTGKALRRHRLTSDDIDDRLRGIEEQVAALAARLDSMEQTVTTAASPTRFLAGVLRKYRAWSDSLR